MNCLWTGREKMKWRYTCVRFKYRLKNSLKKQHWRVTVLICQQQLRTGMNTLQLLTIHTSIQIRPLETTRKLIQMYVLGPVSAPRTAGAQVFKPCQPLLFSSSNHIVRKLQPSYMAGAPLCSGTSPEWKAWVSYQSEERVWNLQNKLGREPWGCSLWEWCG